jgi:hypothetical protein
MRNIKILLLYSCFLQTLVAQQFDMKLLSDADGLSSAVVYSIAQDERGNLWLATAYGLSRYDGHTFKNYFVEDGLINNLVKRVYVDENGLLWIDTNKGYQTYDGHSFNFIDEQDPILPSYFSELTNRTFNDFENVPTDFNVDDTITFQGDLFAATYGGGLWVQEDSTWLEVKLSHDYNKNITDLFIDRDGRFWITSTSGLTHLNSSEFKKFHDGDLWASYGMSEFDDALWFSNRDGIQRLINDTVELYSLVEGANFIICIGENLSGKLQASGQGGSLYEWDGSDFIVKHEFDELLKGSYVYDIEVHKNNTYYACGEKVLITKEGTVSEFDLGVGIGKCYDIQSDGENLWFACSEGLFLYSDNEIIKYNSDDGMSDHYGRVLEVDSYGSIWFGTLSSGLIRFDGEYFKTYNKNNGLNDDLIKSLKWDSYRNCLWVGTNEGLHSLNINKNGEVERIEIYAPSTGYPFYYCHNKALLVRKDSSLLFSVNTHEELSGYNLYSFNFNDRLKRRKKPNVFLESFQIRNSVFVPDSTFDNWEALENNHQFNYLQNDFTFQIGGVHLSEGDYIKYQWCLEGYDEDWRKVSIEHTANYTNLSHGSYKLRLRAKVPASDWSEIKSYSFSISPPVWRTGWFIGLICLLIIGCIYTSVYYIQLYKHRQQSQRLHQQKQKAELELKALRAQFNPHFVFNILNSIQSIIMERDDEKAIDYLYDFSVLMRTTLNFSSLKVIPFSDELDFLKRYVNLEQIRFEKPFQFEVVIDDLVDVHNIKMPPLVLQPYIENAIKHGLFNKKEKLGRKLSLSFSIKNECLKCIIVDNGIGRSAADRKKDKSHVSKGITMMKERIDYLNIAYETTDFTHSISDVLNDNKVVVGTEVILYIPISKTILQK